MEQPVVLEAGGLDGAVGELVRRPAAPLRELAREPLRGLLDRGLAEPPRDGEELLDRGRLPVGGERVHERLGLRAAPDVRLRVALERRGELGAGHRDRQGEQTLVLTAEPTYVAWCSR